MEQKQQISFHDKTYIVLSVEQEYIIHPAVFEPEAITEESLNLDFSCDFSIQNNRLMLDFMMKAPEGEDYGVESGEGAVLKSIPVLYNGAILIGREPVTEYLLQENRLPYFSYKQVYELVFNNGVLVTTVEHSRAMFRIRKNLELGLRSLAAKRDVRCIRRFMNSSFIGDYRLLSTGKRLKYLKELKDLYQGREKDVPFSDNN
jgi:hypothetical protein